MLLFEWLSRSVLKLTKVKKILLAGSLLGLSLFKINKVESALRTHQLNYVREAGSGSQALTGL